PACCASRKSARAPSGSERYVENGSANSPRALAWSMSTARVPTTRAKARAISRSRSRTRGLAGLGAGQERAAEGLEVPVARGVGAQPPVPAEVEARGELAEVRQL